jgi:hypothetical protein
MMISMRPNLKHPANPEKAGVGNRDQELRISNFEFRNCNLSLKLVVFVAYSFGLLLAVASGAGPAFAPYQGDQVQSKVVTLDVGGTRGDVSFNHKTHEARLNPDPNAAYKAKAGAACSGCHHTMNSRGIPQLWKCSACHRGEGDPRNPRNRDFDEAWSERAFHDSCIGCHRASTKGPTTCGECHKRER